MKVNPDTLLVYAVTDRAWLGEQTLAEQVEQTIQGGATLIQLREKELSATAFLEEAKAVKQVTDRYHIPFVINDAVEIAIAVNADGVHVGQKDMAANAVRQKLGKDKIIGVSVQTVEQALLAERQGADYLGVGAVFSTATKLDASEVSFATLQEICNAVSIPVVAIGGITAENVSQLQQSGIAGIAVVSAIFAQKNIKEATQALVQLTKDTLHP